MIDHYSLLTSSWTIWTFVKLFTLWLILTYFGIFIFHNLQKSFNFSLLWKILKKGHRLSVWMQVESNSLILKQCCKLLLQWWRKSKNRHFSRWFILQQWNDLGHKKIRTRLKFQMTRCSTGPNASFMGRMKRGRKESNTGSETCLCKRPKRCWDKLC